jgi:hypothetical protein
MWDDRQECLVGDDRQECLSYWWAMTDKNVWWAMTDKNVCPTGGRPLTKPIVSSIERVEFAGIRRYPPSLGRSTNLSEMR